MHPELTSQPRHEERHPRNELQAVATFMYAAPGSKDLFRTAYRFVARNCLLILVVYAIFVGPGVYLSWDAILNAPAESVANPEALTLWAIGFPFLGGLLTHLGLMAAALVLSAMALVADPRGRVDISEAMSRVVAAARPLAAVLFATTALSFCVGLVHPFLTFALLPFIVFAPLVAMNEHTGVVASVTRGLRYLGATWVSIFLAALVAFLVYLGGAMSAGIAISIAFFALDAESLIPMALPLFIVWATSVGLAMSQAPAFAYRHVTGDPVCSPFSD
ncbi:MAG: hypothetical protein ACI81R_002499 [Bradymonadia bacterium]|jgi:hypothetical protein